MLPAVPIFLAAPVPSPAPAPPAAAATAAQPRRAAAGRGARVVARTGVPVPGAGEDAAQRAARSTSSRFDSPGLVAYYSVVRTGSRNEVEPGKSGFAHFFEHLMFRGSEKYTAEKYNAVIKEMGADSNAFTSDDLTVYHILASKTALPKIVEIEADRFQHLSTRRPKFQKEARAVLGEYNKNASNPIEKMVEALYDNAFTTHTYKHTTMGFLKDIENMPKELVYSRQFFDRYYRPENVILLVVGDADPEKVFRLVEKSYGEWKPGSKHPAVPVEPPQKKEKRAALSWKGPTLPMLLEGYHTPAFSTTNVNVPTLDVLAELLFAERAPLYKRLVIKEQKVETLVGLDRPARRSEPVHRAGAHQEAGRRRLRREGDPRGDGARSRARASTRRRWREVLSHVKYAFAGQLSTADKTATTAASFLALTGDLESINAYFALFDKVTSADVKRVAAAILRAREPDGRDDEGGQVMRTLRDDDVDDARRGEPARRSPRRPAAPRSRQAGAAKSAEAGQARQVERRGIRTVFLPSPANPLVALRVFFQVGAVDDPAGKEGLASLTAEMLGKGGSKARTYAEVLDALYPLAAQIRVYGDKESIVFEGTVHRDNLARFADLLADQILTPRFADDDFTRNRQDALDYITKTLRGNNDEDLGKEAMATILFYNHPYGAPTRGTVAGLNAITLDDVRTLYASHFTRDRLVVGVAGGYPDGFAEAFVKRFAALPAKAPPLAKLPPLPKPKRESPDRRREGRARVRDLDRAAAGRDPQGSRLLPADRRALVPGRAPHLQRRADAPPARGPRAQLRRLRVHRELHPGRLDDLPAAQHRAPPAALRDLAAPGAADNGLFALRAALYETDKLIRDGIPQAGFEATKKFLMNYSNLWAQDASRRLGYAIDARGDRQGPGQGAAGAAAQDEEGRGRRGHAQAPERRGADDRHRRRQGAAGRRHAALRRAHRHQLRHGRHAARGGRRGRPHQAVPGPDRKGERPGHTGRQDVREVARGERHAAQGPPRPFGRRS